MNKASMKSINQLKEIVENEPECKIDYLRPKQGAEMYNIRKHKASLQSINSIRLELQ